MITHFIFRDLKSNRIYWLITLIVTLLAIPAVYFHGDALLLLFYPYFFMSISPLAGLIGSRWRAQHVMSRHYLLSLPVSRIKLFRIIQLRAFVFQIPLYLLLTYVIFTDSECTLRFNQLQLLSILLGSLIAGNWFINLAVDNAIAYEAIGSHQVPVKRIKLWIALFARMLIEILIIGGTVYLLQSSGANAVIYATLAVSSVIAVVRYKSAQLAWIRS